MSNDTITDTELANSFHTRVESALRRADLSDWIWVNGARVRDGQVQLHLGTTGEPLGWALGSDLIDALDAAAAVEVTRVIEEDGTVVEEGIEHLDAFYAAMHRRWIDEGCSYVSDDDGEQD